MDHERVRSGRTGFLWLASYPKSGSTWVRLLIQSALADGAPVNINAVTLADNIAVTRNHFDAITQISSSDLTASQILGWRPAVLRAMAEEFGQAVHAKTHAAQIQLPGGDWLHPPDISLAALVIVRDPRAIAPSLARHMSRTIDDAITLMATKGARLAQSLDILRRQLVDPWGSWSENVSSWLDKPVMPTLAIRYEDLCDQPHQTLKAALEFLGHSVSDAAIARAVDHCTLDRLAAQESAYGFREWPDSGERFFGLGRRPNLTPDQSARIIQDHGDWMIRLGYRPQESGGQNVRPNQNDAQKKA
jgi:aryl sulfotransferase